MGVSENNGKFYPDSDFSEKAWIKNIDQYKELFKKSIDDPEGFWSDIASELVWFEKPEKILDDRIRGMASDILRLVMERGTGRGAKRAVKMTSVLDSDSIEISLPLYGKTGTSNRFTNSILIIILSSFQYIHFIKLSLRYEWRNFND